MPTSNSPQIAELNLPGAAANWAAIGFTIVDDSFVIGQVKCQLRALEPSWGFAGAESVPTELDGIKTTQAQFASTSSAPPQQPNGAFKIDHVVVISESPSKTKRELEAFGLVAKGERVFGGGSSRRGGVFFWSGDLLIELVGPADETSREGSRARIWGVTFAVSDFDRLKATAGGLLGEPSEAVQPGRQIATIEASASLGLAAAFITPHVKAS